MNELIRKHAAPSRTQVERLKEIIAEMVRCCEDRRIYEHGRFGLPYAELRCLMLFDGERYLTVKGMAERMDVAKSRITKIVDGLAAKGFVKKVDDPDDGRVVLISLTPAGRDKAAEIDSFHHEIHCQILEKLNEDERFTLLSHLEVLRCAMKEVKEGLH
ncbi:MAG: MarR family transcriptional regulator [Thermodesulfobacteriota bacterium]